MTETCFGLLNFALSLLLAPALIGVINRTKAFYAGRQGQPLLQPYYDILKLLRKGSVYSRSSTDVLRLAPLASLASILCAAALVPFAWSESPAGFFGDIVLFAYLLGLARFLMSLGALDTGSSFEGMGASREMQFATLAEPAFLLGMACLACVGGDFSLSVIYPRLDMARWLDFAAPMVLVSGSLLVTLLAESSRVPFDDPNTHLELTMVHEAMILDYGGPDLALILYGASLKMWLYGSLLVMTVLPFRGESFLSAAGAFLAGMLLLGVVIGTVESIIARFRFIKIPQMLVGASALSLLALLLALAR